MVTAVLLFAELFIAWPSELNLKTETELKTMELYFQFTKDKIREKSSYCNHKESKTNSMYVTSEKITVEKSAGS
jgi:hypothetical protein